ncbi:MAG: hypothetical protein II919_07175 [Lachnospiraceae bacterium]|nr:hypothetical protein [Lachnospiraceae bacterium]
MTLKTTSKSMVKISIRIAVCVVVMLGIFLCAKNAYIFGRDLFAGGGYEKAPGHDLILTVTEGESEYEIAKEAADIGIVKSALTFYIQIKLYTGENEKIIPGDYRLNSSKTGEELVEILTTPPGEENTQE